MLIDELVEAGKHVVEHEDEVRSLGTARDLGEAYDVAEQDRHLKTR